MKLLITCEHASSIIPKKYQSCFNAINKIDTHRIFDSGAIHLARTFSKKFKAPLFSGKVTRLIVDLNRTSPNPKCISSFLANLSPASKKEIIDTYHKPHWDEITQWIKINSAREPVIHIAVHSFTSIWNGSKRPTDIGLLYDPRRSQEKRIAQLWRQHLSKLHSELTIHMNRPYRGWTDGITNSLRKKFNEKKYIGFELEVNQRFCGDKNRLRTDVVDALNASVQKIIQN